MHPYLFSIGGFKLASYGVLVALGYTAAVFYLFKHIKTLAITSDRLWDLVTWIVLGALLGGKLLFAFFFWNTFPGGILDHLVGIIKEFRFGFVFYGGLMGGALAGYLFARRHKLDVASVADHLAPAAALGHAIGRLGCFMAGCCYGRYTDTFLGVKFTDAECLVDAKHLGLPLHPTQLYESGGNLLLFFLLHRLLVSGAVKKRPGLNLLAYILGYGLLRFCVEFFRGDDRGGFVLGLSPAQQLAALALPLCAALYFFWLSGLWSSHERK